jgi:peptidoglycan hydrolase-like protein with peptidoglycan-binding domain
VVFKRDLTVGSIGSDVKELQEYLNDHGFVLASTGPGSPGHETMLFGDLTRATLARFQRAEGISPAIGYFGPVTREYVVRHP